MAVAIVVVYVAGAGTGVALDSATSGTDGNAVESALLFLGLGAFAVLGALLVDRRAGGALGPIFAAIGLSVGVGFLGNSLATWYVTTGRVPTLPVRLLAWPQAWYWYPMLVLVFVYVPLLFPDGHLPSRRWRWIAWPVGIGVAGATLIAAGAERISLQALGPDGEWLTVVNPFGVAGLTDAESSPLFGALFFVILPGVVAGIVSIIVRFRRSHGIERLQVKWFLLAVCLIPLSMTLELVPDPLGNLLGGGAFALAIALLPTSIGIAVLRYRLFEIDRIVSRTVSYAVTLGLLVAVYAGAVVGLRGLLSPLAGDSDLAVAGSTLVVAALFGPVVRHVRSLVDRRFNRSRYDAAQAAEAFGTRLRDEVDLGTVVTDLRGVVDATLSPASTSIWLRSKA